MNDLELRLTDLLARKADEVDVRPVDGFAEAPYMTALASTDPSETEARDLVAIDLEPTDAQPVASRNRRRAAVAILAAAAVIVAIAVVATRDEDATPADQPSPTVTVTVTVTPTTPQGSLLGKPGRQLAPGTYFIDNIDGEPTPRILVTVGEGWGNDGPMLYKHEGEGAGGWDGFMMFSRPGAVFSDACHPIEPLNKYALGPVTTVDGLVAALTAQKGWADVTAPSDISVDGYVGKAFQRTAPADMSDCDTMVHNSRQGVPGAHPVFLSWVSEKEGEPFSGGGPYDPGTIENVWVLDIDGTVVLINTRPWPEASAAAHAAFAAVLDSIRIERGSDTAVIPGFDTIGTDVTNPLELVHGSQTSGADIELFRVTSDQPRYWRLTTLPMFDGQTWRLPNRPLSPITDTADSEPDGRTIRQQLQILALQGQMLPAAADPIRVDPNVDLRLNSDTSTLLKTSDLVSGEQYTIVSDEPDVTPDELRAATTDKPPDDLFLGLPDNVPGVAPDLATEVTAAAATDYDRMIALQNWFHTFDYSTELQPGHSSDAIETFLGTRSGFSEQFAATFAVMARTLGIPSRVAVGFTPGTFNADGSYSVLGRNSHAWPEVWFDGIGWVPFEPTPHRGIPGAEAYTGVEADEQAAP